MSFAPPQRLMLTAANLSDGDIFRRAKLTHQLWQRAITDLPSAKIGKSLIRYSLACLIGSVAVVCGVVLFKTYKARFVPTKWHVVERGLIFRSGQIQPTLVRQTLLKHRIAVVVDLTSVRDDSEAQNAERSAIRELGIQAFRFPMHGDGTGRDVCIADAVTAIAAARRSQHPVLVHCTAGAQRTGTVLATYQLLVERRPPAEIVAEHRCFGWTVTGANSKVTFLNSRLARIAKLLYERGVIDEVPNPLPRLPAP